VEVYGTPANVPLDATRRETDCTRGLDDATVEMNTQ
jgi:hypothetical protein